MFMPSGTPSYWQDERPRQSLRSVSLNTATVLLHECGLRHLRSIETGLIIHEATYRPYLSEWITASMNGSATQGYPLSAQPCHSIV